MISKRQINSPLTIQLPDMMNSVASQGSISNFVAQTPKENRLIMNFKRSPNLTKLPQQKENTLQAANHTHLDIQKKNQLPYKMVASELPASCSNHSDKQSSFYIESDDGQLIFYCEKCAILVASQGFQVKKIESNLKQKNVPTNGVQSGSVGFSIKDTKTVKKSKADLITKEQKQAELTNFLNNLERIQSRMDNFFEKNESHLMEIDSAAQGEGNKIKQLFSGMHKILDDFEQGYLEQLQSNMIQSREPLEAFGQQLNNDTNTLESMKEDICQAYDDIINQTTASDFETVMNAYKENVTEIEEVLIQNQIEDRSPQDKRKEIEVEIRSDQLIHEIQKQLISRVQSTRRQSIKSTKRRISIGGNKIR